MGEHLSANDPHQAKSAGGTLWLPKKEHRRSGLIPKHAGGITKITTTYRTVQTTNSKAEEIDGVDLQAGDDKHVQSLNLRISENMKHCFCRNIRLLMRTLDAVENLPGLGIIAVHLRVL